MNRLADLAKANSSFEFPTQFCIAGEMGRSLVCFHNFYDQIFPNTDVPVDLHLCGFDQQGSQVGALTLELRTGQAAQVSTTEVGMTEPGLVAVGALPRFDLQKLAAGKLRVKRRVGTGFYMIWQDRVGHVDTMHEWMAASTEEIGRQTFYMVFHHANGRIARCGMVLMCPILDSSANGQATVTVYTHSGRVLFTAKVPPLRSMGSRVVYLDELFVTFPKILREEATLGVKVETQNLAQPFSFEVQTSGDFHIHHL